MKPSVIAIVHLSLYSLSDPSTDHVVQLTRPY